MGSSDLIILRHLLIEKNVSTTARLMNVSQPAITMRLGRLRTMFKDDILVRDGNKMKLTPKARDMVNPIIRITDEMLALIPEHDFDPHTTPTVITIQMTEAFYEACAKMLIDELLSYHSQHKINMTMLSCTTLPKPRYPTQNIDVVIGVPTHIEGFCDEIYGTETGVLIYDQYFDEHKQSISYEEYLQAPHIVLSEQSGIHQQLNIVGTPDPRNIMLQISSLKIATELLQDHYVMTDSTITARIFNKNYLPLPFLPVETPLKLSYPEHLKHDKKNRWIRDVCNKVMQELLKRYCS